ncbi:MAG: serine hydrolase domain-containing protein [Pseudomonadota bacterium]
MRFKYLVGSLLLCGLLSACGGGGGGGGAVSPVPVPAPVPVPIPDQSKLPTGAALLAAVEQVRASNSLPGLQVVVVDQSRIETVSTGKRNVSSAGVVSDADQFQIGSLSKAASAILIARLVEQKKLRWDSSMAEIFPAWSAQMNPSMRTVTVQQLLRHRAGLQRDIEQVDSAFFNTQLSGDTRAERAMVGKYYLGRPPALTPDSAYFYSNIGYLIVGLVAETVTGEAYPSLMQKEVFGPMAMAATFGLPEDAGAGGMSGHIFSANNWQVAPYGAENRLRLGWMYPAGGMMVSMGNYGKYLHEHLQGLQGKSTLLSQETFKLIHTGVSGYGFGWGVGNDAAHGGAYSAHNGTIGTYYSSTMIIPATGRAIAVSCNCGGPSASAAVEKLVTSLAWANP